VHAESQELTVGQSSRSVLAELEAIRRATFMAEEAKARLHIVHISCGRGVVEAAEAKARGVDVSIETCPHYLYFTEEDVERLGALVKCAPPLRNRRHRSELRDELSSGTIDIVASDHSPAPPNMKTGDFARAWGGIAGVQSTLAVLLEQGLRLERIAQLLAATPARRFRIRNKGAIRPGNHADLTLVDLGASFTIRREDMASRHGLSPYVGKTFRGAVRRTIRRGETIFLDGAFPSQTRGQLVRPER
jgi:allantoinase